MSFFVVVVVKGLYFPPKPQMKMSTKVNFLLLLLLMLSLFLSSISSSITIPVSIWTFFLYYYYGLVGLRTTLCWRSPFAAKENCNFFSLKDTKRILFFVVIGNFCCCLLFLVECSSQTVILDMKYGKSMKAPFWKSSPLWDNQSNQENKWGLFWSFESEYSLEKNLHLYHLFTLTSSESKDVNLAEKGVNAIPIYYHRKGHVWRDTRAKAVAASNVVLFFQDWMEERTTKWQSPRIHHTAENGLHFQARSCLHFRSIWSHK